MKKLLLYFALLLTGGVFAQGLPPLPIDVGSGTVDTAAVEARAGIRPVKSFKNPPAKGMILMSGSKTNGGSPGSFWVFPDRAGIGTPVLTQSQLDDIAAQVGTDETRIVEDSILVYTTNGSEVGRDTLRGLGGDSGPVYVEGPGIDITGNQIAAQVVPQDVTNSQIAAQNYADLRTSEVRSELADTAAAIRSDFPVGGGSGEKTIDSLESTGNSVIRIGLPSPETGSQDRLFEVQIADQKSLSIEYRPVNQFNRSQNVVFNGEVNGVEGGDANWVSGGSTGAGNWIYGTNPLDRLNGIYGGYFDTTRNSLATALIHVMRSEIDTSTHTVIVGGSEHRSRLADYSATLGGRLGKQNASDYSILLGVNNSENRGVYNLQGPTIQGLIDGTGNSTLTGDVFNVNGNGNSFGRLLNSNITGNGNFGGIASSSIINGETNVFGYLNNSNINGDYTRSSLSFYSKSEGNLAVINGVGVAGRKGGEAKAMGYFDEIGDAQKIEFIGIQSVGAGGTGDLRFVNNPFSPQLASSRIDMRDSTIVTLHSQISATNQDLTKVAGYIVKAVIVKIDGVITVKSFTTETVYEDVSEWNVRIEKIGNTNIYIRVYGDPTDPTKWVGETTLTEIKIN